MQRNDLEKFKCHSGRWGNLQLTDGEVTLRPAAELIELLRYAGEIELTPMLMTHGDALRSNFRLLERLVTEGGLREISIHIDTTQRGRSGPAYHNARLEEQLHPLRGEFAELIRRTRKATGQPLRAASTVTVTEDNLQSVPSVAQWFLHNSDAFRLVSFLPAAQVGRTANGVGGRVDVSALWQRIAQGLGGMNDVRRHLWWMGHPDCNRILSGLAYHSPDGGARLLPFSPSEDAMQNLLDTLGPVLAALRHDSRARALLRLLAAVARNPAGLASMFQAAAALLRRLESTPLTRLKACAGAMPLHRFSIVSHHFMDAGEIETPAGRERLANCVFRVPAGGEMVSMCQFNALGGRDRFYRNAARG